MSVTLCPPGSVSPSRARVSSNPFPGSRLPLIGFLAIVLSGCASTLATFPAETKITETPHFKIHSKADPRLVDFVRLHAETFYEKMTRPYFPEGFGDKSLSIYLFETQEEWEAFKGDTLHSDHLEDAVAVYQSGVRAIYLFYYRKDGSRKDWGTLYHEIIHHFVEVTNAFYPSWFTEGLAQFLGNGSRFVKNELVMGWPQSSWRAMLQKDIASGILAADVRDMMNLTHAEFYQWEHYLYVPQALFYWLHETEKLESYLALTRRKGYDISVLEEAVGMDHPDISKQLFLFIRRHSNPLKFVYEPDLIATAERQFHAKRFRITRTALLKALEENRIRQYVKPAYTLIGRAYYGEKEYEKAAEYLLKALDHAQYAEDRHLLFFYLAASYDRLGHTALAQKWAKTFLEENWEPKRNALYVSKAKKILGTSESLPEISFTKIIEHNQGVAKGFTTTETPHFKIRTETSSPLVGIIEANAEAYYNNMTPRFFPRGFGTQPLSIYFFERKQAWKRFFRKHKVPHHVLEDASTSYLREVPAVYVHLYGTHHRGEVWENLFRGITKHFIEANHGPSPNTPGWFHDGLAAFLGNASHIAKGGLTVGRSDPVLAMQLKGGIQKDGLKIDVQSLLSLSEKTYSDWEYRHAVARVFFYWMHHRGKLDAVLKRVRQDGYRLKVLEEVLKMPAEEINQHLLAFIKEKSYPIADLANWIELRDSPAPMEPFRILESERLDPDGEWAALTVAQYGKFRNNISKTKQFLQPIFNNPESPYWMDAAVTVALRTKNPEKAVEFYLKAVEHGKYDVFTYKYYYFLAVHYAQLGQFAETKKWAQRYVDENWEPQRKRFRMDAVQEMLAEL